MNSKNNVPDQLQSLYQTICSKARGYCGTEELLNDFYDDYKIDGHVLAKNAGFSNFKELLESTVMQNKVQSEVNYLGHTVYKGRYEPRIRHIRPETRESVRNQESKDAREVQQSFDMAQMNNTPPRMIASNQNSHGRNSTLFDFDNDGEHDDYGLARNTSTGVFHAKASNHFKGSSNIQMKVKDDKMWECEDDEEDDKMWECEDDEEDDKKLSGSAKPLTSTDMIEKQQEKSRPVQWTNRGSGEFTDTIDSDDEGDNAAILPNISKDFNKETQSVHDKQETARCQNPFSVFDNTCAPNVPIVASKAHGQKWIEAAIVLREENKAKERQKDAFETNSFIDYQGTSQIEKDGKLKENKTTDAFVDKNFQTNHCSEPVSISAYAPLKKLSCTDQGIDFRMKRSKSGSITSNAAARRISKPLTEDDLNKVGEVVIAIVKYTYPRAILLDDLLVAMDLIEPRFLRLEELTYLSYKEFFERWCKDLLVFGKTGKQNLLWHER